MTVLAAVCVIPVLVAMTAAQAGSRGTWSIWSILCLIACFLFLIGCSGYLLRFILCAYRVFRFWSDESGFAQRENMSCRETADNMITTIGSFSDMIDQEMIDHSTKILTKRAELEALQSQINPHFLYNTLDAIRGLAIVKDVPEIAEMTGALSSMFRYSISSSGEFQTFGEDMENLDNYILIQKYRFTNRFDVVKEFQDTDEIMDMEIPKLMLQPIIENAIYHGIEQITEKGLIRISAFLTDRTFVVRVSDNGIGMDAETLDRVNRRLREETVSGSNNTDKGTGIALVNINKRIKLYFGEDYGLALYSTKGLGTTVQLTFPGKII